MRRLIDMILVLTALIGLGLFTHQAYAGGIVSSIPFTGDFLTFTFNTINSTTSVQISTYSQTRNNLICHNEGSSEVYLSTGVITGNQSLNQGYVITPDTGSNAYFQTYSHAAVWAIGSNVNTAAKPNVVCQEERQ